MFSILVLHVAQGENRDSIHEAMHCVEQCLC